MYRIDIEYIEELEKNLEKVSLLNDSLEVDNINPSDSAQAYLNMIEAIMKISGQLVIIYHLIKRVEESHFSNLESYQQCSEKIEKLVNEINLYKKCNYKEKYPNKMKERIEDLLNSLDTLISDIHQGLSDEAALAEQSTGSSMALTDASAAGVRFDFSSSSQTENILPTTGQSVEKIIKDFSQAYHTAITHLETLRNLAEEGDIDAQIMKAYQDQVTSLIKRNFLLDAYLANVASARGFVFSPKQ